MYYTRNQALFYLWEIKPMLKRYIVSSCYFRNCTYLNTCLLILCEGILSNVNFMFLQNYFYKIVQFFLGSIAYYDLCKKSYWRGEKWSTLSDGRGNETFNCLMKNVCLVYISNSDNISFNRYIIIKL